MNILPKKRWHVRTRENIARVRKDEQEAREEIEENKKRVSKAEQEARTTLLLQRARTKYGVPKQNFEVQEQPSEQESNSDGHVNFFEELEQGKVITTKSNAETELEEKEKREKYEKQIGYLTYLGQDTVETTGKVPWYDKVPQHHQFNNSSQEEKNIKSKLLNDPLTVIRKYIPVETKPSNKSSLGTSSSSSSSSSNKKHSLLVYNSIHKSKRKKKQKKKAKKPRKRHSSSSSSSSSSSNDSENSTDSEGDSGEKVQGRKSLEQLRAERLKREKEERERTEKLLARLQGKELKDEKEPVTPVIQRKYNSQYNPELAKQNFALYSNNQ